MASTGRISVKFDVGDFNGNLSNQNLVKTGQKYQARYIKTYVHFIFAVLLNYHISPLFE